MPDKNKYIFTPFDTTSSTFDQGIIPSDISELVTKAEAIARVKHPDYPEGIWWDNVQTHLIRCALTAQHLDLPGKLISQRPHLVRTVWIHDLPEVLASMSVGFDTSAVVKEDKPDLAKRIEQEEDAVARQILSARDYKLFENFESARKTLDGNLSLAKATPPIAYLARLIDVGDGELCFYYYLTRWLMDDAHDGRMPTERPYLFTADRYETFSANLSKLQYSIDDEVIAVCQQLIRRQVTYILNRWKMVEGRNPQRFTSFAKAQVERLSHTLCANSLHPQIRQPQ